MTDEPPTPITDDAPAQRRAEIGKRVLLVLFVLWLVGVTLAVLYGLALLRGTQLDGLAIAKDSRRAAEAAERGTDRIEDCTTPKRRCFVNGQKRSGKVVGALTTVQRQSAVYAAACADAPGQQTANEIETCVLGAFADQPDQPANRNR